LLGLWLKKVPSSDPSGQPFSGSVIGDTSDPKAATTAQFGEFWGELAGRFVNTPNVIFGINNEPHDMVSLLFLLFPQTRS
jgi:endoglucanase